MSAGEPVAAEPKRRLEPLTPTECWELLDAHGVGRVVFVDARGPVALPVNYVVDDGDLIFRTAEVSSVSASTYVDRVGFEVDRYDETRREGWSVLANGKVRAIDDPAELREVAALGVVPWAEGQRTRYLRLTVRTITGRHLVPAEPEAEASRDSEL